ncbi:MAG: hypothetical protein KJ550_09620 [Proteobacteria bacterium]|nr:hypothetical protein [Pseudomonadota bacterium]MBU4013713.1 hypothetical protein [Pseudomonadota bacterium]MBU4067122.1 hypothetical protein [Pseudomonadota bacterium]MBU4127075.1 hypothetical protein [Pseudomonadota bacterium]MBU4319381.1 hypothetical protein [Pseudomonadota bacterium]
MFFHWDITNLKWPIKGKTKPDLIIFDPPASPEGEADGGQVQNTPAKNETRVNSILINDYVWILNQSGWQETHIFQATLSSERFKANVVSAMHSDNIVKLH